MFSDEILEEIFSNDKIQQIPICYQTIMIQEIAKIIEDHEQWSAEDDY